MFFFVGLTSRSTLRMEMGIFPMENRRQTYRHAFEPGKPCEQSCIEAVASKGATPLVVAEIPKSPASSSSRTF